MDPSNFMLIDIFRSISKSEPKRTHASTHAGTHTQRALHERVTENFK